MDSSRSNTPPRFSTSSSNANYAMSTPRRFSSPKSNREHIFGDRFIPSRISTNLDDALDSIENINSIKPSCSTDVAHENQGLMNNLLRSELLGKSITHPKSDVETAAFSNGILTSQSRHSQNFLKYSSPKKRSSTSSSSIHDISRDSMQQHFTSRSNQKSLSTSPKKSSRKISKVPYKVLDAPNLADDYYLNLVDWSSNNNLAVALGSSVFLWSAATSKVTKLCDMENQDAVTSITWAVRGSQIAVGTFSGGVQIWDAATCVKLREMRPHTSRVGTLAWSSNMIASGSRDRTILVQDVRVRSSSSTHTTPNGDSRPLSRQSSIGSTTHTSPYESTRNSLSRFTNRSGSFSSRRSLDSASVSANSIDDDSVDESYDSSFHLSNTSHDDIITGTSDTSTAAYATVTGIANATQHSAASPSSSSSPNVRPISSRGSTSLSGSMTSPSSGNRMTTGGIDERHSGSFSQNRSVSRGVGMLARDERIRSGSLGSTGRMSDTHDRHLLNLSDPMIVSNTLPLQNSIIGLSTDNNNNNNNNNNSSTSSINNTSRLSANGMPGISSASANGFGSGDPCIIQEFSGHKQEVCGLKWSFDERMLASGGNDNKLYVWQPQVGNRTDAEPICRFCDHTAAVKAVAWSPHQHGLLASGGGTADRHIRFWNASTGLPLHRIDTGSQVCNLVWSSTVNEIVSTHGYSLNQIIVWKYPSMQKLATLTGHSMRVLYLAMSPDGQSVVTGAGDETLRFWNVFPGARSSVGVNLGTSLLFPSNKDIR